jgi:curli biogenesis system outer membrane secretion channel CsgG
MKERMMKRIKGETFWILLAVLLLQVTLAEADNTIPAPPEGNLRYSVTVTKFKNEAGWHGRWKIGDGMTTIMTDVLHDSGWFIVLGDDEMRKAAMKEQDFAASGRTAGGKKSAKIGRMTPAQLLVRGSVTHVQDNTKSSGGGLSFKGISLGGSAGSAEINFTIYLVDAETGQVVASKDIIGKSGRKGFKVGYHGSALGGLTGKLGGKMEDNVGEAAQDAIGQAVQYLIGQLESIPWEGTVMLVKGDKIIVNRGSRDGVSVGRAFKVGEIEELVDPDTGEVLDVEMTQVGTIEVTKVKEKIAYCKAKTGSGFSKGMSIFTSE